MIYHYGDKILLLFSLVWLKCIVWDLIEIVSVNRFNSIRNTYNGEIGILLNGSPCLFYTVKNNIDLKV